MNMHNLNPEHSEAQLTINREIAAVTPVLNMERVPGVVSFGHERFFDFIYKVYAHAQENILSTKMYRTRIDTHSYKEGGSPMAVQVLLLMGDPNSGKTFIDRTIEHEILPRLDTELPLFQDNLYSLHVQKRNWEENGEKPAIMEELIKTPVDQPFERHELHFAEDKLIESIKYAISHPTSALVQVELPGGIAAPVDGIMQVYRPFGPRIVRQLVEHQGEFEDLKYDVWAAAFVGGAFLKGMRKGRERVRRAKSLKKAEEFAHFYGLIKKDVILTANYWKSIKNGAYLNQFRTIDACVASMMEAIKDTPEISNARIMAEKFQYNDELSQLLVSDTENSWYTHPLVQGARWQMFLKQSIKLDPERAFIGFYNPTPAQSGLDAEDIARLKADLAKS